MIHYRHWHIASSKMPTRSKPSYFLLSGIFSNYRNDVFIAFAKIYPKKNRFTLR